MKNVLITIAAIVAVVLTVAAVTRQLHADPVVEVHALPDGTPCYVPVEYRED